MAPTKVTSLAATVDLSPLADLMRDVWPGYYGPDGHGDALADLVNRRRQTGFPYGMAASIDGVPVGTGALTATDSFGANLGEGPWLIGLAVHPDHRRQGIATALIAALEDAARTQDATMIYCTTQAASGMLLARHWRPLRRVPDDQGASWQVFRKTL